MPNWNSRGKAGGRRQADGQVLHDRQRRIRLHGAHQAQHRGRRHLEIGVERQHQLEALGVVVEEIHDVAGLEAGVHGAPAVADARRIAVLGAERAPPPAVRAAAAPVLRVGQDKEGEAIAGAGQIQLIQQPPQRRQHAAHVLVADRHGDRGARQRCRRGLCADRGTPRAPGRGGEQDRRSRSARWPGRARSRARCRRNAASITSLAAVQPPGASTCSSSAPRPRPVSSTISTRHRRGEIAILGGFLTILSLAWRNQGRMRAGVHRRGQPGHGFSSVFQRSRHRPPDTGRGDRRHRPPGQSAEPWLIRCGRPIFPPDMNSEPD